MMTDISGYWQIVRIMIKSRKKRPHLNQIFFNKKLLCILIDAILFGIFSTIKPVTEKCDKIQLDFFQCGWFQKTGIQLLIQISKTNVWPQKKTLQKIIKPQKQSALKTPLKQDTLL